jgi:hypothetical protein
MARILTYWLDLVVNPLMYWYSTCQISAIKCAFDRRRRCKKACHDEREVIAVSLSKRDYSAQQNRNARHAWRKLSIVRFKFHPTNHEGDEEIGTASLAVCTRLSPSIVHRPLRSLYYFIFAFSAAIRTRKLEISLRIFLPLRSKRKLARRLQQRSGDFF